MILASWLVFLCLNDNDISLFVSPDYSALEHDIIKSHATLSHTDV